MSKFLIHFQDQLAGTTNPDPVLDYYVEVDGKFQKDRTRKSQMVGDLIGMRFVRMQRSIPVFVSELVDA